MDLCVPAHHHAPMAIEAARAGKHVIVEKPLTGFFGPPDTPREEMLRARAGRRRPGAGRRRGRARAALLRGELGVRAADPEGAPAARRLGRADPAAGRRGEPLGHARADQQALGDRRRRLADRQGLPSARRRALSEGGRGPAAARRAGPAGLGDGRGRPARRHRDLPRRHAALPQHRRGRRRGGLGHHADHLRRRHGGADLGRRHRAGRHPQLRWRSTAPRRWCSATSTPTTSCRPTRPTRPCSATSTSWRRSRPRRAGPRPSPTRSGPPATRRRCRTSWSAWPLGREPLSNGPLARDVTAVIYGAYLSAHDGRRIDLRPYL